MRSFHIFVFLLFATPLSPFLPADRVVLQNGDRLTGKIVESDPENLILESEFAGKVTIRWDAVAEISSDDPLYLTLSDEQIVVGSVNTVEGKIQVKTEETGTVTLTKDAIRNLRSPERQEAYRAEIERLRDPGLTDLWKGSADVGLSLAKGNADSTSFAFAFNAARKTTRDRIGVYANSVYASNSTSGTTVTTANAVRGGARYDVNLSDRTFVFGLGDLEFDEFQNLDLRVVLGGGYGWRPLKSERTTLDVFGGGSYNREFFTSGMDRTSGEILFGEEFSHQISDRTSLSERLVFYPNLNETGEYRLNFDISAATEISGWLNWHVSVSDRFLSNPVFGAERNDVLLSTGLRVTFGKK